MEKFELQELFESLTLNEKIGQLVQLKGNFFSENTEINTGPIKKINIDQKIVKNIGSILNTMGAESVISVQKKYLANNDKQIPLLFMADIINGFRTVFPISLGLGSTFDPDLIKQTAQVAASEAAVSGVHVTFSPMVDLVRDARWGRVMESYGEDTYLNSLYAKSMVEGYQKDLSPENSLVSCVKHFAAYGAPIGGREYNTVEMGERTLLNDYLPSYYAAVEAGCQLVMTSFNTIDGIPVTGSKKMLREILRKEWGFEGVIIADHSAVKELITHGVATDEQEAAKMALEAGCDIDMMTAVYANFLGPLIESNSIEAHYLDEAVMRVLNLKNMLGLFENPFRGANPAKEKIVHTTTEALALAKETVIKSCVLLKNENSVLPLKPEKKIALIGPYSNTRKLSGMWSFAVDQSKVVTLKEGFTACASPGSLRVSEGSPFLDADTELDGFRSNVVESIDPIVSLKEALEVAKESDVIVLAIGEHVDQSGEGGSRAYLRLPEVQMKLLKAMKELNKPIVTLLFSGRPLIVNEIEAYSDAVLQCWIPGTAGGIGIAELVYGIANPSGKLAMTFPFAEGQCPIYYNHFNTGRPVSKSGVGTRFTSRYLDIPNHPAHVFGYGLSYSRFIYGKPQLDKLNLSPSNPIEVSISVLNESLYAGWETVQLYICDCVGSVVRPVKELKGIEKIYINPQETKIVRFTIEEKMLRFIRGDLTFASEPGVFKLYLGTDSEKVQELEFYLTK